EGFQHQVQDIQKDKFAVSVLFTGLKIAYKDKKKVDIPAVGRAEQIEYQLGSKILELTLDKKPVIAVDVPPAPPNQMMQQMGRQPQPSGYEWLQHGWGEDAAKFEFKTVNLSENNSIPADAALFVLVRPKELDERQRYEVVKYLAGGGKVLLLASPFKVAHEFGWRASKTPTGLEDYLATVGITFNPDFVCDHSNLRMPKSLNVFTGEIEYSHNPFFVRILGENIDQESVLTRFMPGLLMPSPAEIKVDQALVQKNGLTERLLAKTSRQSWTIPFNEAVNPENEMKYDADTKTFTGAKTVFVMLEGQFPFPYEGKPAPEWKPESSDDKDKDKAKEKDKSKEQKPPEIAKVELKPGALVLCSSPEAFHSMYLQDRNIGQQMQGNASLVVNIAETFSLGDDLVKLRSRHYETRSIDILEGKDSKRNWIKFFLIAGMPLVVFAFAVGRAMWRSYTQNRYERGFAETTGPSSFTT
ncbi:MAG: Gldg family protein, partial [Planctomycetota bacterium]